MKVTKVHQPTPRTMLPGFPIGYSPTELAMHPLISAAMRCYIPRMIHDEGRELLAAENRKASVIFVNLRLGLDQTVSESKLGKLLLRVHAVLRTMQQIIFNNDGYRRQFLMDDKGCVLIVVFGVPPYAHEKDCYRTVKCALELRQALAEVMPCWGACAQNLVRQRYPIQLGLLQDWCTPVPLGLPEGENMRWWEIL